MTINKSKKRSDIAIVGMACRFPGANSYNEFWNNLKNGINSIREISSDRWSVEEYYSADRDEPNKSISKWGGLLDQIDQFDNAFFNISAREAQAMDPQQRLLLEETWHCIEDSGILLETLQKQTTSVFVGVMSNDYHQLFMQEDHVTDSYDCIGNYEGILANRLSYYFNFTGDSRIVDAACASSLVSIRDACESINKGESDFAIAAGVSVICHPWKYISFSKAHMLSPDGQCKTFDAEANGYVPGEGVGVLLLESLEKALEKKHRIYGVIKGTAVHHSGKTNTITAPRVESQRKVIEEAQTEAALPSETITYIEAHGTGTSLGDPIEIEALSQAFNTNKKQYCHIGSVKTNIGHLEAAAGVAGVIKVLLMFQNKQIPKTLNINHVNPIIDFENTPFILAKQFNEWQLPSDVPIRRAGVSSFGFGGMNSHIILEEYTSEQKDNKISSEETAYPFILSAKTAASLKLLLVSWQKFIDTPEFTSLMLKDIAYTLSTRKTFNYRFGKQVNKSDLIKFLREVDINQFNPADVSLHKTTLCLNILGKSAVDFHEFEKVVLQFPLLDNLLKRCLAVIPDKNMPRILQEFLMAYVFSKSLILSGLKPQLISGEGVGFLAGLVLSDVLDFSSAVNWLSGATNQLTLNRPAIPFFDTINLKKYEAYRIDETYLQALLTDVSFDKLISQTLFSESRQLYQHQYTFKKNLNEWEKSLKKYNISIASILKSENLSAADYPLLFYVVLLTSRKKLNEKWNLSEKIMIPNPNISEIVDLILDEVITKELAIELFLNKTPKVLNKIANHIQLQQHNLDSEKPYKVLKAKNLPFQTDVLNPNGWLHELVYGVNSTKPSVQANVLQIDADPHSVVNLTDYLVELWNKGMKVNWHKWYSTSDTSIVSLPSYTFAREHHWAEKSPERRPAIITTASSIHPLLDTNISTLEMNGFTKIMTGDEFYLTDHRVNGVPVLPSAIYLEMARVAAAYALPKQQVVALRNIIWAKPVIVTEKPQKLTINLYPKMTGLDFKITSQEVHDNEFYVHAQGKLILRPRYPEETVKIDIKGISSRCKYTRDAADLYAEWEARGIECGPSFRVINEIDVDEKELLAKIHLPQNLLASADAYVLHPSIIDAALETIFEIINRYQFKPTDFPFPFSIGEIQVFKSLDKAAYVYAVSLNEITPTLLPKFDISITDKDGTVLVAIKEFALRFLQTKDYKKLRKSSNQIEKQTPVVPPSIKEVPLETTPEVKAKIEQPTIETSNMMAETAATEQTTLYQKTQDYLKNVLAGPLKLSPEKIQSTVEFSVYGIDSMMIMKLNRLLEDFIEDLPTTLFFEYQTLDELTQYFVDNYAEDIAKKIPNAPQETKKTQPVLAPATVSTTQTKEIKRTPMSQDIAIIGLSGIFPQAENLEAFWENLKQGKNSITEIPQDRWDMMKYFNADKSQSGKSYGKWGGFINDVDKFDPLFFNISPREAEFMDPQERLFLQVAYHTIENAGYTREQLQGKKVGVYAGVMYSEYQLYGAEATLKGQGLATNPLFAYIPNRVSYYFDLHGPSIALDTMCSSSLTTIHLACQSLISGECELALAGGVNLSVHPNKYLFLSRGRFLSSDGYCHSFGEGGDGYVPGEGVGAVLLKPLEKALADKDYIYGVIKFSRINHGGRTHGFTVPNPNAQGEMIAEAYQSGQIDPNTITYIEAHGTGTALGDPIEITGLGKVFNQQTCTHPIAIGSVKANIGHLESAAGIAAVSKVLLQMQHKQLVPSILSDTLNPNIKWQSTPFKVQHELNDWHRPNIIENGVNVQYPLRAGISSFGAGGSNAHIILEEAPVTLNEGTDNRPYYLFPFSAKTEAALARLIQNFKNWLRNTTAFNLADISYALCVGRSHLDKRTAIVATSKEALLQQLDAIPIIHQVGNVKAALDDIAAIRNISAEELKAKLQIIAAAYVKQENIDFNLIFSRESRQKIPMPGYPFEKERYWVETNNEAVIIDKTTLTTRAKNQLVLTGKEFFLSDHRVANVPTLPAVVYLELIRATCEQDGVNGFRNVTWQMPVQVLDKPVTISIDLLQTEKGHKFKVISENDADKLHAQGEVITRSLAEERIDINAIKSRCSSHKDTHDMYKHLSQLGIQYGHAFQVIDELSFNQEEVFAHVKVPADVDTAKYKLHPSLMDGALQTIFQLSPENVLCLPFSVDEIVIYQPIKTDCYVYTQLSPSHSKHGVVGNIKLVDINGVVLVAINKILFRPIPKKKEDQVDCNLYQPVWKKQIITSHVTPTEPKTILVLSETQDLVNYFKNSVKNAVIIHAKKDRQYECIDDLNFHVNTMLVADYEKLFADLKQKNRLPTLIFIHLQNDASGLKQADISKQLQDKYYALFHLTVALVKLRLKDKLQVCMVAEDLLAEGQLFVDGLSGFAKTLRLEYPKMVYKIISLSDKLQASDTVRFLQELTQDDVSIRYDAQRNRYVKGFEDLPTANSSSLNLRVGGTYLITGGLGGLGKIVAMHLAENFKPNLVLTGRSELKPEQHLFLESLKKLGAEAIYHQADITNETDTAQLIQSINTQFGNLNGIVHSAGVLRDAFVIKKTLADIETVLAPKVYGTLNLDKYTQNQNLDFMVLFSSITAEFGNVGQCDYSYANGFMDSFAHYRNDLVNQKLRSGKTISINWSLWDKGGMNVDEGSKEWLREKLGIIPITTEQGMRAFIKALTVGKSQCLVVAGDKTKFANILNIAKSSNEPEVMVATKAETIAIDSAKNVNNKVLYDKTIHYLKEMIAGILKIPVERMHDQVSFPDYGIDSVVIMSLNTIFEKTFDNIPKTLLFEYQTLQTLSDYFVENYTDTLAKLFKLESELKSESAPLKQIEPSKKIVIQEQAVSTLPKTNSNMDIAIIGLSGIYPQANNVNEFWQNLLQQKNTITEIPLERWNHALYFDPEKGKSGKAYSKWGSFITTFNQFDPLFFYIAPTEAEFMDPQERLFLETAWNTIEDAGYKPSDFSEKEIGVFVGVMNDDYQLYSSAETSAGNPQALTYSPASIANRVSFYFNLNGPSLSLDTMCSSSLTAIHLACESLRAGECEQAIAGGVNVIAHPTKYIKLCQMNFLSTDGQCRSFAEGGDGYVPGEGVGAVLLKPLAKALEDGDHIYGVIKGSAINHGGKTNGFTVPNPNAQAKVIAKAFKKSNIEPDTISYIETHGTGTSLGDPIEIAGLSQVFGKKSKSEPYAIGSVKSNIGHLESAAGIAAVTKVLMQLKHKTLVPSLHAASLNKNINWTSVPFKVQTETADWKENFPRRACISSFGAGGSNAHLIIEEPPENQASTAEKAYYLVTLSAKSEEALERKMTDLQHFMHGNPALSLGDLSYTLNIGREDFAFRIAFVVSSINDFQSTIDKAIRHQSADNYFLTKEVEQNYKPLFRQVMENVIVELQNTANLSAKDYHEKLLVLAGLYVNGLDFNKSLLYKGETRKRLSLPTYPFKHKVYWYKKTATPTVKTADTVMPGRDYILLASTWEIKPITQVTQDKIADPFLLIINDATVNLSLPAFNTLPINLSSLTDTETGIKLAEDLLNQQPNVAGLIDVSDVENSTEWMPGKIGFIQTILKHKLRTAFHLIHVNENLKGAALAPLLPVLKAEHKNLLTKSIAVEDMASLNAILLNELESDDVIVRYQNGKRFIPQLKSLSAGKVPASTERKFNISPEKIYIVTGGTRGIGNLVAQWLIKQGAKHLILTGIKAFPPRYRWQNLIDTNAPEKAKLETILNMEKSGASIDIFIGSLSEKNSFNNFLQIIKQRTKKVGGVFHCAGVVDEEPIPFIEKNIQSMERILEPKIHGLTVLHETLQNEKLEYFVLFSSISAIMPTLGVGLSDYALANGFMNAFAEYQHRIGNTYYQSICWPSWKEIGIGEIKTAYYLNTGWLSHTNQEGLFLLEESLTHLNVPVVVPGVVDKDKFSITLEVKPSVPKDTIVAPSVIIDQSILSQLKTLFAAKLHIPENELDENTSFTNLGVDSILLAAIVKEIEKLLHAPIDPGILIEYSSLKALANYFAVHAPVSLAESSSTLQNEPVPLPSTEPVAIIGIACHFPKAKNKEEFWNNLTQGIDCITTVPTNRWDEQTYFDPSPQAGKTISKWGGFLADIEYFDPVYFGINKESAAQVDPLERQALEVGVEAINDAGYKKTELADKKVGIFIGSRVANYSQRITEIKKHTIVGMGQNFIAAYLSDYLNTKGPSLVVDTACSSSLVSVHLACQSLRSHESEMALAGGVDILLDEKPYQILSDALSPDGKCHTFDVSANGFVPGEGCGMLVLKLLSKAVADGDHIYAVIEASAVNNDGHTMGITTPNPQAQQDVIESALKAAQIDPATISYIEAHGTGTMIGDPIEARALTSVFKKYTDKKQFCGIGSVKTNIGHTLSAAGSASLIKVALSLSHQTLVPTLHCTIPNPRFDFANSPFYPNTQLHPWEAINGIRRAGISGFGFGGTNAHVILRDYQGETTRKRQPLPNIKFNREYHWLPNPSSSEEVDAKLMSFLNRKVKLDEPTHKIFESLLEYNNPIVRDHQVHAIQTMPGLTLLDMIYRWVKDLFPVQEITLKNILFNEAIIVTPEANKIVTMTLKKLPDYWDVKISSHHPQAEQGEIFDNFTCQLYLTSHQSSVNSLDLAVLNNKQNVLTMEKLYAYCAEVQLKHGAFMQCNGDIFRDGNYFSKLKLTPLAAKHLSMFAIHPALLDASAVTLLSNRLLSEQTQKKQLFIPFYVKEFKLYKGGEEEVIVKINTINSSQSDVMSNDVIAFDATGNTLFSMIGLSVKQVRSKETFSKAAEMHAKKPEEVEAKRVNPADGSTKTVDIEQILSDVITKIINQPYQELNKQISFYDLGLDSKQLLQIVRELEKSLTKEFYPTMLFEYNTINELLGYLQQESLPPPSLIDNETVQATQHAIAQVYQKEFIDYKKLHIEMIHTSKEVDLEVIHAGNENAEPLILLSPLDTLGIAWRHQFEAFSKQYHVMVIQYPGVGQSQFNKNITSLMDFPDLVIEVLDKMNINQPYHLIGWSMGGIIAQIISLRYPTLVKSLILVNSASRFNLEWTSSEAENFLNRLQANYLTSQQQSNQNTGLRFDELKGIYNLQAKRFYYSHSLIFDASKEIHQLSVPMLVVVGDQDEIMSFNKSVDLWQNKENIQMNILHGAGHYIPLFNANFFNKLVINFLNSLREHTL